MPPAPVPPEVAAFLARPNNAVLATLRPDGSPHTVATWYEWRGDDTVLVNMDVVRPRVRWLATDGRVSLTCIDPDSFYRHVSLLGRVVEIRDDVERADIHRLSERYTGKPYPRTTHARVSVVIRVDAWYGWDRDPRERSAPDRARLPV